MTVSLFPPKVSPYRDFAALLLEHRVCRVVVVRSGHAGYVRVTTTCTAPQCPHEDGDCIDDSLLGLFSVDKIHVLSFSAILMSVVFIVLSSVESPRRPGW